MRRARSSLLLLLAVDVAEPLLTDRNEGVDDDCRARGAEVTSLAAAAAAEAAHQRPNDSAESSLSLTRLLRGTSPKSASEGEGERALRTDRAWNMA